jgi:hypothetical protein
MFIKEYNTNRYIFLNYDEYPCKRNYYDELIRIQYNKVYTYPDTIEKLDTILKESSKQIAKQNKKRNYKEY